MRVLVVDDDDAILKLARVSLEGMGGHRVFECSEPEKAHAIALAEKPDVVLLDLMMPRMDGRQVLAVLRGDEKTRPIPVILLTAFEVPDEMKALGVKGVITKPFHPSHLAKDVERILHS